MKKKSHYLNFPRVPETDLLLILYIHLGSGERALKTQQKERRGELHRHAFHQNFSRFTDNLRQSTSIRLLDYRTNSMMQVFESQTLIKCLRNSSKGNLSGQVRL